MTIDYVNGVIDMVTISSEPINSLMTSQEKLTILGCAIPNATVLTKLNALEQKTGTRADLVDAMIAAGSINAQRGTELKA